MPQYCFYGPQNGIKVEENKCKGAHYESGDQNIMNKFLGVSGCLNHILHVVVYDSLVLPRISFPMTGSMATAC